MTLTTSKSSYYTATKLKLKLALITLSSILVHHQTDAFARHSIASHTTAFTQQQQRYAFQPLHYRDYHYDETATLALDNPSPPFFRTNPSTLTPSTPSESRPSAVNENLIQSLCLSQAALVTGASVLAVAVLGPASFLDAVHGSLSAEALGQGVLASLPLIAAGTIVAESSRPDASRVNLSTINLVLSLFGRRREASQDKNEAMTPATSTAQVIAWSVLLSSITALSEEVIFRGILPSIALPHLGALGPAVALLGSAAVFTLAHLNPTGSTAENRVVAALQGAQGLWYGLVCMATGGNLIPVILAHLLYDVHTLVETWHQSNDQLDHVQSSMNTRPLTSAELEGLAQLIDESQGALTQETMIFARRLYYSFDKDHQGRLSRADVQRAMAYAFVADEVAPTEEQVNRTMQAVRSNGRLRFDEFLRVLFAMRSQQHRLAQKQQAQVAV
jgi:membrane protease YdiL (CAAX protease family)